jgi:hypothetical protein
LLKAADLSRRDLPNSYDQITPSARLSTRPERLSTALVAIAKALFFWDQKGTKANAIRNLMRNNDPVRELGRELDEATPNPE